MKGMDTNIMSFINTLGKRVRLLRQDAGISQKELVQRLANKYGIRISRGYMSQIESQGKIPSSEVIVALAKELGTTTDYLLLLTDNPFPPSDNVEYMSEEADEVARIVDELPPAKRRELLEIARTMRKMSLEEQRELQRDMEELRQILDEIEAVGGPQAVEKILDALEKITGEVSAKFSKTIVYE